jgi:putative membrane protein
MNKLALFSFAIVLAAAVAPPAQARDKADRAFIKEAVEGNLTEIEMGRIAQQKGQSDAVREFGKMLETDHGNNNERAKALGRARHVTVPTRPGAEERRAIDMVSHLSPAKFDRMFARHMVADHKEDIRAFEKAVKSKDAEIATYARETLVTLHKHLRRAEELAGPPAAQASH